MKYWFKYCVISLLVVTVTACSCKAPLKVRPIQRGDKKMSCKELILEINEAEHYREAANEARHISVIDTLTPWCAASEFTDGNGAITAADERIDYLGQIYDLLECGGSDQQPKPRPPAQRPKPRPVQPPGTYQNQSAPAYQPPASAPRITAPKSAIRPGVNGEPSGTYYGKVPGSQSEPHYRSIPQPSQTKSPLHEHEDIDKQRYQHSHPHFGSHWHAEDIPSKQPRKPSKTF